MTLSTILKKTHTTEIDGTSISIGIGVDWIVDWHMNELSNETNVGIFRCQEKFVIESRLYSASNLFRKMT